jgi:hypothetical protein
MRQYRTFRGYLLYRPYRKHGKWRKVAGNHVNWVLLLDITISGVLKIYFIFINSYIRWVFCGYIIIILLNYIWPRSGCCRPSTDIRSHPRAFPGIVSRRKSSGAATGIVIYAPFGISGIPNHFSPDHWYDNSIFGDLESGGWLQPFSEISRPFRVFDMGLLITYNWFISMVFYNIYTVTWVTMSYSTVMRWSMHSITH